MRKVSLSKKSFVSISSGEYSDHSVIAFVDWMKGDNPEEITKEALKKYLAENPDQRGKHNGNAWEFAKWLVSEGYADPLEVRDIHVGSYGNLKINEE